MPKFEYDDETHTYKLNGNIIPSVTTILKGDFSNVNPLVLKRASNFGTAGHLLCHYEDEGTLEEKSVDAGLLPLLAGWRKFKKDFKVTIIKSEMKVYSEEYQYAGTLDKIILFQDTTAIVDIKTGAVPKSVDMQLSAYKYAFEEMSIMTGRNRIAKMFAVQLKQDGTYSLKPCIYNIAGFFERLKKYNMEDLYE